jgi:uncharacterized protein (TIGR02246 family)
MTHKRPMTWGIAGVSLMLVTAVSAAEDVQSAIESANRKWEAAVIRGDGPGVATLYTADAELLPYQSDFVSGRDAIGKFWQGAINSGIKGVSLTTVEVEGHGNTAHEVGTYELRGADGKPLDHGKYIVIWKKVAGSWKLHRDIWTSSVAPAKP